MGIVFAAEMAPVALLGIPSGTLVARLGARRSMLVADFARAPLIAAIPVLHSAGALSFPLLLVLVALVGCFNAPYFGAQRVVLPELVGEDEQAVAQANAFVEGGSRLASLLGPPTAGLLIVALGVTNVVYIDAATYVASFAPRQAARAAQTAAGPERGVWWGARRPPVPPAGQTSRAADRLRSSSPTWRALR